MIDPNKPCDCTDIKALLSALIDDRLDAAARHGAERHLAGCPACRDLLDQAERNEALIAAGVGAGAPLPEGFEAAVLARTARAARGRPGSVSTWFGWVAMAASVFLVLWMWVSDRQSAPRPAPEGTRSTQMVHYTTGPQLRSWTLEGDLPVDALIHLESAPDAALADARGGLSRTDAETLESASLMLALLEGADVRSFDDLEEVRRATEYDELLPRMALARRSLAARDQPLMLAAESILYRVLSGPVSLEDARELRETVTRLDMARRLNDLAARPLAASAL